MRKSNQTNTIWRRSNGKKKKTGAIGNVLLAAYDTCFWKRLMDTKSCLAPYKHNLRWIGQVHFHFKMIYMIPLLLPNDRHKKIPRQLKGKELETKKKRQTKYTIYNTHVIRCFILR